MPFFSSKNKGGVPPRQNAESLTNIRGSGRKKKNNTAASLASLTYEDYKLVVNDDGSRMYVSPQEAERMEIERRLRNSTSKTPETDLKEHLRVSSGADSFKSVIRSSAEGKTVYESPIDSGEEETVEMDGPKGPNLAEITLANIPGTPKKLMVADWLDEHAAEGELKFAPPPPPPDFKDEDLKLIQKEAKNVKPPDAPPPPPPPNFKDQDLKRIQREAKNMKPPDEHPPPPPAAPEEFLEEDQPLERFGSELPSEIRLRPKKKSKVEKEKKPGFFDRVFSSERKKVSRLDEILDKSKDVIEEDGEKITKVKKGKGLFGIKTTKDVSNVDENRKQKSESKKPGMKRRSSSKLFDEFFGRKRKKEIIHPDDLKHVEQSKGEENKDLVQDSVCVGDEGPNFEYLEVESERSDQKEILEQKRIEGAEPEADDKPKKFKMFPIARSKSSEAIKSKAGNPKRKGLGWSDSELWRPQNRTAKTPKNKADNAGKTSDPEEQLEIDEPDEQKVQKKKENQFKRSFSFPLRWKQQKKLQQSDPEVAVSSAEETSQKRAEILEEPQPGYLDIFFRANASRKIKKNSQKKEIASDKKVDLDLGEVNESRSVHSENSESDSSEDYYKKPGKPSVKKEKRKTGNKKDGFLKSVFGLDSKEPNLISARPLPNQEDKTTDDITQDNSPSDEVTDKPKTSTDKKKSKPSKKQPKEVLQLIQVFGSQKLDDDSDGENLEYSTDDISFSSQNVSEGDGSQKEKKKKETVVGPEIIKADKNRKPKHVGLKKETKPKNLHEKKSGSKKLKPKHITLEREIKPMLGPDGDFLAVDMINEPVNGEEHKQDDSETSIKTETKDANKTKNKVGSQRSQKSSPKVASKKPGMSLKTFFGVKDTEKIVKTPETTESFEENEEVNYKSGGEDLELEEIPKKTKIKKVKGGKNSEGSTFVKTPHESIDIFTLLGLKNVGKNNAKGKQEDLESEPEIQEIFLEEENDDGTKTTHQKKNLMAIFGTKNVKGKGKVQKKQVFQVNSKNQEASLAKKSTPNVSPSNKEKEGEDNIKSEEKSDSIETTNQKRNFTSIFGKKNKGKIVAHEKSNPKNEFNNQEINHTDEFIREESPPKKSVLAIFGSNHFAKDESKSEAVEKRKRIGDENKLKEERNSNHRSSLKALFGSRTKIGTSEKESRLERSKSVESSSSSCSSSEGPTTRGGYNVQKKMKNFWSFMSEKHVKSDSGLDEDKKSSSESVSSSEESSGRGGLAIAAPVGKWGPKRKSSPLDENQRIKSGEYSFVGDAPEKVQSEAVILRSFKMFDENGTTLLGGKVEEPYKKRPSSYHEGQGTKVLSLRPRSIGAHLNYASDTESADHGSTDKSSVSKLTQDGTKKSRFAFLDLMKKNKDRVESIEEGKIIADAAKDVATVPAQGEPTGDRVVYAELDIVRGADASVRRDNDPDKTEYAEIIHPNPPLTKKELRKSRENLADPDPDLTTTPDGKKEAAV